MRGTILEYDPRKGVGVISGIDGNRYNFEGSEFKNEIATANAGAEVDFVNSHEAASQIYLLNAASEDKSRLLSAVLAVFLGNFGAHKFYLGYNTAGIIMLVVSMVGLALAAIPTGIIAIISIIEGVIYILKSDTDFRRIYQDNSKEWF